ncbi:MAG: hypothetical protein K5871_08690 [Lachnospiraceae bacterium]|nr:hypothetical protein [Lachnospiraceae bacterium]
MIRRKCGEKSHSILPVILPVTVFLIITLISVICIRMVRASFPGSGATAAAVFIRDGSLFYAPDASAGDPELYEICDIKLDDMYDHYPDNLVRISPDNKYIYFFDNVNEDSCGCLCRIRVGRIGADKDKNIKLIEKIDDEVSIFSLAFPDAGMIAYVTGKDLLIIYDGQESVVIGGVSCIEAVDGEDIYYAGCDDETPENTLFAYSIADEKVRKILDSFEDIGPVTDDGFYYVVPDEREVTLYDYVNDPYAGSDEDAVEPVCPKYNDAFVPVTYSDAFDPEKLKQIDTEYDGDYIIFIEDNFFYTVTYNGTVYYFIYNYHDSGSYYYDPALDEFYRFDEELLERLDEQYQEDLDDWNKRQARISLRRSLQSETVDPGFHKLMYYHDGESTCIADRCTEIRFETGGENTVPFYLVMNEEDIDKVDIDDITSSYQVYELLFGGDDTVRFFGA